MADKVESSFEDCGVSSELVRAVKEQGYKAPTAIQQKAIPSVLMGRDVIAISQTGSGKTAGFALPILDILAQGTRRARMPRCLILEPTRELATQVQESMVGFSKYSSLKLAVLIGGVAFEPQQKELMAGVDIIIATPGRLLDHIARSRLILTDVSILVIDEADRMLDMGFIPDIIKIIKLLPKSRQTLLFSATMANEIKALTNQFMDNPKTIEVAPPASTAESIEQWAVRVRNTDKLDVLCQLLNSETINNGLIFCNRKKEIGSVVAMLKDRGIKSHELHGDMDQYKRLEVLNDFRQSKISLLICSDVAARGLDIPLVSHVFNLDVPTQAEDYVHRIGRTGRAGRHGKSFTFYTKDDLKVLKAIEKLIGKAIPEYRINDYNVQKIISKIKDTTDNRIENGHQATGKRNSFQPELTYSKHYDKKPNYGQEDRRHQTRTNFRDKFNSRQRSANYSNNGYVTNSAELRENKLDDLNKLPDFLTMPIGNKKILEITITSLMPIIASLI